MPTKNNTKRTLPVDTQPANGDKWWIRGNAEACDFFDISSRTLSEWEKRGAPKISYGKWDVKKLIDWKYGSSAGDKSPAVRKAVADADYREMKAEKESISLSVLKSEYISKAEVDQQWYTIGTVMKTNMLLWSRTIAPELAHQDMRSVVKILTEAVYDVLEQLSSNSCYKKTNKK